MVHIIVDGIMCDTENVGRVNAGKAANKAILATAFGAGVQLGITIVNYGGKAASVIKNTCETVCNKLQKRF